MDVGVEFEHYRVIEHIGRGGMADVWSARDLRLNRIVAIKTIARDLTLDTDPVKMFEHEARTIAALEHPHILPVYGFGEYERQLYIAMRYIAGGSLDDILELGPMTVENGLAMARMIASALDHAHRSNVVHLDLKPSNILLDSQGHPYLADFGLATVMDREGRARNPGSGTLLYMAPEQVTSDLLTQKADLYSFCVLLFHLFTGTLPFDGTLPLALQQLQAGIPMPDVSLIQAGLPYAMTELLRRGTAIEPFERPQTAGQIIETLAGILEPTPLSARERPVVERVMTEPIEGGATVNLSSGTIPLNTGMMPPNKGTMPLNNSTMPLVNNSTMPLNTPDALALREALDIYNKARRAWAFGQGRFTLGITDFSVIHDYYRDAELHRLELDEPGMQMLLRGALEYDVDVDVWWERLQDESRRWVALHALRGQNAAARVRALERLIDLPDSEPPQIPKLVAQALQVENHRPAQLAAIRLLKTRAAHDFQPITTRPTPPTDKAEDAVVMMVRETP